MKLTWFGGSALRTHIGGQVVVIDADRAASDVDQKELLSGADRVLALTGQHPSADGITWKPRPAQRLLDVGEVIRSVDVWSPGELALVIDPDEDMPLLLLGGTVPALGRWVEKSVVLMVGTDLARRATELLETSAPRLLALASVETEVDRAIEAIRHRLDSTGLIAMEQGLAVEI